jgi:hypothetical protein
MNAIEKPKRLPRFSQSNDQESAAALLGVVGRRTGLQAPDVMLSPTTGLADVDAFFGG